MPRNRTGALGGDVLESELVQRRKQKLSLNLTDEAAETVRKLAEEQGTTVSEVIRRGISLEKFILDQKDATFLIRRKDGSIETVHFMY